MKNIITATGVNALNKYIGSQKEVTEVFSIKSVEELHEADVSMGDIMFLSYNLPGKIDLLNVLKEREFDLKIVFLIPDGLPDETLKRIRDLLKYQDIDFYFGTEYRKSEIRDMIIYDKDDMVSFSEITALIDDDLEYEDFFKKKEKVVEEPEIKEPEVSLIEEPKEPLVRDVYDERKEYIPPIIKPLKAEIENVPPIKTREESYTPPTEVKKEVPYTPPIEVERNESYTPPTKAEEEIPYAPPVETKEEVPYTPPVEKVKEESKKPASSNTFVFTPPKEEDMHKHVEAPEEPAIMYERPTQIKKPNSGGNKAEELTPHVTRSIDEVRRAELNEVSDFNTESIIEDPYNYDRVVPNLAIVSSIKPGTGKSFLSVNIASAIARYGKPTKSGKRPIVGLIEGDLQNLSVGTLLGISDNKRTIKSALDKISEIITNDGTFIGNTFSVENVNNYVRDCFIPYTREPNLLCLVGSQLKFEDIKNLNQYQFKYLVESMSLMFDVLIVDTNSALTHISSYPLLKSARSCYYVLNLDYNNIKNNSRYRTTLKNMGIMDKVKYIINEDITKDIEGQFLEKLECNRDLISESGFNVVGSVPIVDKSVFLNRIYKGLPIVLDENTKSINHVRQSIFEIANDFYPIDEKYLNLGNSIETKKDKPKKGIFKFFG